MTKQIYIKIFKAIERIIYAFQMYPTKNLNAVTGISRTAYPDGTVSEYLGAILPSELKRNKVKAI